MQTQEMIIERERLEALGKYKILDTQPEPAFDRLTLLAAQFFQAPFSLLTFIDERRQWVKSKVGLSYNEAPRETTFCVHAIAEPEFLVITDATQDERFVHHPLVKNEPHVRFYAGSPLIDGDGYILGTLCVMDVKPRQVTFDQLEMLRTLGEEAIALLELRRTVNETSGEKEHQILELKKITKELTQQSKKHHVAESSLRQRERKFEDAERIAHLGSWEWDVHNDQVIWSTELYHIFGEEPDKFRPSYRNYLKHVHPDDRLRSKKIIDRALIDHRSFTFSERIIRPDGTVRYLRTQGKVLTDRNNRVYRMTGCSQDVTEQRKIEEKLEHSVSLLNATLESTADGILVVDQNGHLASYNSKFVQMWRLPPTVMESFEDRNVLGSVLDQLVDPHAFLKRVDELYERPGSESFDVLKFKDGRTFERYSKPQRIRDEIVGRVWSFRDVTERYKALATLQESEQRYRSLIVASSQILWTTDADGKVRRDIQTWREFTGQTLEEIRGDGWINAVHPKDRKATMEIWKHATNTKTLYQTEYRLRRADGEWRHMIVRGVPVTASDGTIREWVGFCHDITEQKRAERIIRNERDFSEAIINSLPGIFYLLDEKGLNLRWNRNLEIFTEYSSAEMSTMYARTLVAPEEHTVLAEAMERVFLTGEAEAELTVVSKSGKRIAFYCTGRLANFHGQPCLVGTGIDISSRKKAEEEARKLNEDLERRVRERTAQLKASNKELEAFSYTVSHDLRAPLRAISGFVSALDEDSRDRLNADDRIYLDRIKRAGERMTHLIEDLLTYSRIGRAGVTLRRVPLKEIIEQSAGDFIARLQATDGSISIPADLPSVTADPTLLEQIFSNLFENAINYRKKGVPPEIKIAWRREGGDVVVSVIDNGIGIAPQYHDKIFEVFQRLHPDQSPGTGIGLANAKKAIEKLHGKIWVDSAPDKGSTFYLQLKDGNSSALPNDSV